MMAAGRLDKTSKCCERDVQRERSKGNVVSKDGYALNSQQEGYQSRRGIHGGWREEAHVNSRGSYV